jgi:prepilin-type N-terminal cleavage/methylation domain-containing protein
MKQLRHCMSGVSRAQASRGFTLVESIVVVVVLAIAGVGIGSIQSRIFSNQASIKNLQVGARLMQECAEQVLAVRRFTENGYAALAAGGFGTNSCGGVTALTGFSVPTVTFTDPYTGAGCPTPTCKLATVTQNGITPVTLLLVDY